MCRHGVLLKAQSELPNNTVSVHVELGDGDGDRLNTANNYL